MRSSELIERYVAMVERENELRASQLRLLNDSQQAAHDARHFIEMMISREMVGPQPTTRGNPLARPVPVPRRPQPQPQPQQQPPQMEVHGISIDIPASMAGGELGLLQHLFGFLEEPASQGLTDAEIDQACISREWDETTDTEQLPTCPITLARFSQGDRIKKIRRCGHEFSADAITQALRISPMCPLCRGNVTHS